MSKEQAYLCQNCKRYSTSVFSSCEKNTCIEPEKRIYHIKKGAYLFMEKQKNNRFFCIRDGNVGLYKKAVNGEQIKVASILPGELIGAETFLLNEPYKVSAKADTDLTVCAMNGEVLQDLLAECPEIGINILAMLAKRLDNAIINGL